MTPKTVGLIVFQRMAAYELTGPAEAFSKAKMPTEEGREFRCYNIITLGISTESCVTECGLIIKPQLDINDAPLLDTVMLPGGSGIHDSKLSKKIAEWLSRRAPAIRRVATLGSGIYPLAATGLVDRREVTTHCRFARDVSMRFPRLRVNPNCLFVKDGRFYTSAGAMASIDLSLSLIEEDYGPRIALAVARELVIYAKRPGRQEQCSDLLQFQFKTISRVSNLITWIVSHLNENLSVEALAAKACFCPRHFRRRFKMEFGATPADFVERLRLEEACRRLSSLDNSVDDVGISVGYKSGDAFRRAFRRRLGVHPNEYRRRVAIGLKYIRTHAQPRQKLHSLSKVA
ncbi:MAG TPA: helix-turn-helix domain-containing protein [Candidatus Udaeobacter sp.]|nr:helix-turn-helix domain-containing protein [Candidatus Udaeobacter sp.]